VSRSLSSRIPASLALVGVWAIGALLSGRAELVVLGVPFVLFVALALLSHTEPRIDATIEVDTSRLLEGQHTRVRVGLYNHAHGPVEVEVALARSGLLEIEPRGLTRLRLPGSATAELEFTARARRWGVHSAGPLVVRARDPLGISSQTGTIGPRLALKAFPSEQQLRELAEPVHTRSFFGSNVARSAGSGIEFADIGPLAIGDPVRHINWRATAKHGTLFTTRRHPKHAGEIVLLLDTFAEARDGNGGTLDAAVRAAATLARAYLGRRDRVALVDFGGTLQWLEPGSGVSALYRIIDALLSSEIAFSYAWREAESIPRRVLPPGALVVAISPLLDERSLRLITELRSQGRDVFVLEVSPVAHTTPGNAAADALAFRLWRLHREALRARLRARGVAVAAWDDREALASVLEEVSSFRRSARALALR
jgi:uncharacterized protein (DUF58 family)